MELRLQCEICGRKTPSVDASAPPEPCGTIHCPRGHAVSYELSESLRASGIWDRCPRCGAKDAYIQKDVPRKTFLAILIVGLSGALYFFSVGFFWGLAVLLGLTILDAVLFYSLRDVLICYACGSQGRKWSRGQNPQAYDHHVAERYRKWRQATLRQ